MSNALIIPIDRNSFNGVLQVGENTVGNIKIDTGCSFTNIPLMFFGYSESESKQLKKVDIESFRNGETRIVRSLGVETSKNKKLKDIDLMTDDELYEDASICFIHSSNLILNDYDLGEMKFKVNYDRYNYGLVGMNILKRFDFYCGLSKVLGCCVFVGVLKSQEDKSDYYRALEEHFGFYSDAKDIIVDLVVKDEKLKDLSVGYRECVVNKGISMFLDLFKK